MRCEHKMFFQYVFLLCMTLGTLGQASPALAEEAWPEDNIMVVTAEGLSDGEFYKDRRVAYDEALKDAKRQALEKAVGAFVDSSTLMENYQTISDTIETRYQGFIKRIIKIVDGKVQPDGFYHVWIKAEVYTKPLAESMADFSRSQRQGMIKAHGNPTFAVKIDVISDENERVIQRCDVCETEIANRLHEYGYRLVDWQGMEEDIAAQSRLLKLEQGEIEAARYGVGRKPVDVMITGQVKLRRNPPVYVAGMTVRTVSLTSWSVRAVATQTHEIIFSKNFRSSRKTYNDEDEAILAVGKMAGELFSDQVFKDYVATPTRSLVFAIYGLSSRRIAQDMKRDLLSARSITGVRFKEYHRGAEALFDIDYVGTREEFANYVDSVLLKALNRKYGEDTFAVVRESGDLVHVRVLKPENVTRETIIAKPSLTMTVASRDRVKQIVKSQETLVKVAAVNPDIPSQLDDL